MRRGDLSLTLISLLVLSFLVGCSSRGTVTSAGALVQRQDSFLNLNDELQAIETQSSDGAEINLPGDKTSILLKPSSRVKLGEGTKHLAFGGGVFFSTGPQQVTGDIITITTPGGGCFSLELQDQTARVTALSGGLDWRRPGGIANRLSAGERLVVSASDQQQLPYDRDAYNTVAAWANQIEKKGARSNDNPRSHLHRYC